MAVATKHGASICFHICIILVCGIFWQYAEGKGWGGKVNVALHGQVKPSGSMVVGSAVTTLGMSSALLKREDVGRADIFYSDHYTGLFDYDYDLFFIEGWVPGLWEILHHIRIRFPKIIVIYYCLDVTYPGLDVILSLPVDGIVSNSPYLVQLLSKLGRAATILPLAADVDFMRPHKFIPRDFPFVYVGAGGAMLEEKPTLRAMLETAASLAETHVWGQGWEAGDWIGTNITFHGVLDVVDMPLVYSRASVILSAAIELQERWGMVNNRVYEGLACGGVLVHKASEAMLARFNNGTELFLYSSVDDLRCMLRYLVSADVSHVRRRAREMAVTMHSYDHRMSILMSFYQHLLKLRENSRFYHSGYSRSIGHTLDIAQVRTFLQEAAARGLVSSSLDLSFFFPPVADLSFKIEKLPASLNYNECLRREGRGERFDGRVLYVSAKSSLSSLYSFISMDILAIESLLLKELNSEGFCVDEWLEHQLLWAVADCTHSFRSFAADDAMPDFPLPSSTCPLLSSYDLIFVFLAYAPLEGLHVVDEAMRSLPALLSLRGSAQRHILYAPPGRIYPPFSTAPLDMFYDIILYRSSYDLMAHVAGGELLVNGKREDKASQPNKGPQAELLRYQQLFGLDLSVSAQVSFNDDSTTNSQFNGGEPSTPLLANLQPLVVCFSWSIADYCTAHQRQQQLVMSGANNRFGAVNENDNLTVISHHLIVIVEGVRDDDGEIARLFVSLRQPPQLTSLIFLSWNNLVVLNDILTRQIAYQKFVEDFSIPLVVFMNAPNDPRPSALSPLLLCGHYGVRVHLAYPDSAWLALGSEDRGGVNAVDDAAFSFSLKRALQLAWGLIPSRAFATLTLHMPVISTSTLLQYPPEEDILELHEGLGSQNYGLDILHGSETDLTTEILRKFHPEGDLDYGYVLWEVKYGGGFLPGRDGRLCLFLEFIDWNQGQYGNQSHLNSTFGGLSRCALRAFDYILLLVPLPIGDNSWTPVSVGGFYTLRGNLFMNDAFRKDLQITTLALLPRLIFFQERVSTTSFDVKHRVFVFPLS